MGLGVSTGEQAREVAALRRRRHRRLGLRAPDPAGARPWRGRRRGARPGRRAGGRACAGPDAARTGNRREPLKRQPQQTTYGVPNRSCARAPGRCDEQETASMSESGKNRRDRAAAAREEANAGERRRERMVRIIGAVTVLVVVLGIIGVAVIAQQLVGHRSAAAVPSADPNAPLPDRPCWPPTTQRALRRPLRHRRRGRSRPGDLGGLPVPGVRRGREGQRRRHRVPRRRAARSSSSGGRPRSSTATSATTPPRAPSRPGAARSTPARRRSTTTRSSPTSPRQEGDGFTDEQLIAFAGDAGITGADLDTFTQCFADRTYLRLGGQQHATCSTTSSIPGTPLATAQRRRGPDRDARRPGGAREARRRGGRGRLGAPRRAPSPAAS